MFILLNSTLPPVFVVETYAKSSQTFGSLPKNDKTMTATTPNDKLLPHAAILIRPGHLAAAAESFEP